MSGFSVIIFIFGCIFFSCSAEVNPPPEGTRLTFLNGSTATLQWSLDGVSGIKYRIWTFTRIKGSANEGIAEIDGNDSPLILNSSLPRVSVENPATLILHNVTEKYNGTYRFTLAARVGSDSSEVVVYIAVTPSVWINCSRVTTVNTSDDFTCVSKGEGGNPPAEVTWYKENQTMATGVEEATLRLRNVTKEDSGNYTCEAKSHEEAENETEILFNVNYPPEGTNLKISYVGTSVIITCDADALPLPTYKILRNGTVVATGKTFTINNMTNSSVGNYTCCAQNFLGQSCSMTCFLSIKRPIPITVSSLTTALKTTPATKFLTINPMTHTREEKEATVLSTSKKPTPIKSDRTTPSTNYGSGKISRECNSKAEWYIILVSLASGFIAGIMFPYIVSYSRRKFKSRKSNLNPEPPTPQVDSTYQELDLKKMNKEDNYQSLRVNAARNAVVNDDESNYTELNKTRDVDNNYQSLVT